MWLTSGLALTLNSPAAATIETQTEKILASVRIQEITKEITTRARTFPLSHPFSSSPILRAYPVPWGRHFTRKGLDIHQRERERESEHRGKKLLSSR